MFVLMFIGYGFLGFAVMNQSSSTARPRKNRGTVQVPGTPRRGKATKGEVAIQPIAKEQVAVTDAVHIRWHGTIGPLWFAACSMILAVLLLQTLLGKYEIDVLLPWSCFGPLIIPPLSVVFALWDQTATSRGRNRACLWLSSAYLLAVSGAILLEPFSVMEPREWLSRWSVVMTPLEGVVIMSLVMTLSGRRGNTRYTQCTWKPTSFSSGVRRSVSASAICCA